MMGLVNMRIALVFVGALRERIIVMFAMVTERLAMVALNQQPVTIIH